MEKLRSNTFRLIAVLGIAMLALVACVPEEEEIGTTTISETVVEPVEDIEIVPITDIVVIATAVDVADMVGKEVDLDGLVVQNVMGDVAFTVGPDPQSQVLVILDQVPTPDTPMEGEVDVDTTDLIDLTGVIREMPSLEEAKSKWSLEGAEEADFGKMKLYIHADNVTVREPEDESTDSGMDV